MSSNANGITKLHIADQTDSMEVEATYERLESKDKDNSESQRAARCTFSSRPTHTYARTHPRPFVVRRDQHY